ncbi:MAG: (d)CMP kinase [Desulfococcaceae bacterium]
MTAGDSRKGPLITIDGPAGAGKTTVSRALAQRMGYTYVDTGALYRGVAVAAADRGISPEDDAALADLCPTLRFEFRRRDGETPLHLNGTDISDRLRTPEITMLSSRVSARKPVRECLLSVQRRLGEAGEAIFEGRDMGTVVFPDADVKFFLTADLEARAKRRFEEFRDRSPQDREAVQADMRRRDANDQSRALAPLKPAPDAHTIDSTGLSVAAVIQRMAEIIGKHLETVGTDEKLSEI